MSIRIINRPRGTGKTIRLLYASEFTGNNILVGTQEEADMLEENAKRLGLNIPRVLSVNKYMSRMSECSREILIDEAFDVLEMFVKQGRSGTSISGIAITSRMEE